MSNKIDPPTWEEERQEIDERIDERSESSEDDFEELMRDLEELEQERTCFLQGARLP